VNDRICISTPTTNSRLLQLSFARLSEPLSQFLNQCIDSSKRQKNGQLFAQPVDPVLNMLPTYKDVVSRPMDFQTLKFNLNSMQYTFFFEFVRDLCQIFENCRAFYQQQQKELAVAASEQQQVFLQLMQQKVRVTDTDLQAIVQFDFSKVRKPPVRVTRCM
jgi:hypothetical protein